MQAEIIQDPAAFVELDPEMAYTLLDLKRAVSRKPLCLSSCTSTAAAIIQPLTMSG